MKAIFKTTDFAGNFIVRLMVGAVFLSEGIQKFLFPEYVGSGRFEKIGIPNPEFFGPFVGTFEITCGTLILLGLLTRLAAIPSFIIMVVAISTTKLDILAEKGFWEVMHGSRTDWAMLLGCIYLILFGAGRWSLDLIFFKKQNARKY
jgi:putative oxidoreductase